LAGNGGAGTTVSCPTGKTALGGGFNLSAGSITASFPVMSGTQPTGWKVIGSNSSAYTAYVVCTG
jgi:hypothetical protein